MDSHQSMKESWMHPVPQNEEFWTQKRLWGEEYRSGISLEQQPQETQQRGRKSKSREKETKGVGIPNWKNGAGFSLSYTFVPAIEFSSYILPVFYSSSHLHLTTSTSSPHSWSSPGLKVFARSSSFSPLWHQWEQWKPSPMPGRIWRRLQSHISKA